MLNLQAELNRGLSYYQLMVAYTYQLPLAIDDVFEVTNFTIHVHGLYELDQYAKVVNLLEPIWTKADQLSPQVQVALGQLYVSSLLMEANSLSDRAGLTSQVESILANKYVKCHLKRRDATNLWVQDLKALVVDQDVSFARSLLEQGNARLSHIACPTDYEFEHHAYWQAIVIITYLANIAKPGNAKLNRTGFWYMK